MPNFFRLPTFLEWLVIIGVIVVALAVLLPGFPIDFDAPPPRP